MTRKLCVRRKGDGDDATFTHMYPRVYSLEYEDDNWSNSPLAQPQSAYIHKT